MYTFNCLLEKMLYFTNSKFKNFAGKIMNNIYIL